MKQRVPAVFTIAIVGLILGGLFFWHSTAKADSPNIIINELMYNPQSGVDNDEFLEIYNTSDTTVDLSGWCFSGITLCFPNGTSLASHEYGVISPNATRSLSTYGVTTIGTYTGKLDNGGEAITLKNSSSVTINSIDYDDASPWPSSPDGNGPSLELKDTSLDNTQSTSWGASAVVGGTAGEENSLVGYEPPTIDNVTQVTGIEPNQQVVITAHVEETTGVSLVYKEMFEADETITMYDDGAHGDGAASDNIYGATIPGFAASTLIRYKVVANNPGGSASAPGAEDSINYYGYRVTGGLAAGTTPVLEWYIADDDYAELLDDPGGADDSFLPCVIVYGDQVFDNAKIRLKGSYSRTFDKKPFKVNLPRGYTLSMPGIIDTPVSEFHLNSDYPSDNRYVSSLLAWRVFDYAGFSTPEKTKVELRRNGGMEGAYTFIEKYDAAWRQDNPLYTLGAMYENGWEKKWPNDGDTTPVTEWIQDLGDMSGQDLHDYILANSDVPNLINFMAVQAVIRHGDWSQRQNNLAYKDTADTGRWSFMPWDLDLAFQTLPPFNPEHPGISKMIDPTDTLASIPLEDRPAFAAVWNDPEFKAMYVRRVRSLVDELYASGKMEQWLDEEYSIASTAAERDDAIRHTDEQQEMRDFYTMIFTNLGIDIDDPVQMQALIDASLPDDFPVQDYFSGDTIFNLPSPEGKMAVFKYGLEKQTELYTGDYADEGIIPAAQNADAAIIIDKIVASGDAGYVVLKNNGSEAVDISNWTLTSLGITMPGGSVIAAGSEAYIPVKDVAFRQEQGSNHLVLMQVKTALPVAATVALKRADGSISSTYSYGMTETVDPSTAGSGVPKRNQSAANSTQAANEVAVNSEASTEQIEGVSSDRQVSDDKKRNPAEVQSSRSNLYMVYIGMVGLIAVCWIVVNRLRKAL